MVADVREIRLIALHNCCSIQIPVSFLFTCVYVERTKWHKGTRDHPHSRCLQINIVQLTLHREAPTLPPHEGLSTPTRVRLKRWEVGLEHNRN